MVGNPDITRFDSIPSVREVLTKFPTETVDKLKFFSDQLLTKNKSINLTSLKDPDLFWMKNVLDSLSPFLFPDLVDQYFNGNLLDLGTGGGFPLVPLAIAFESYSHVQNRAFIHSFTGMDSVRKKLTAVREVAESVGIHSLRFLHGRAEDLGHSDLRESYSIVVSRAVAPLNILLELISPFLSVEGYAILYKGPGYLDEMKLVKGILNRLSLDYVDTRRYSLPDGQGDRALIVFRKNSSLCAQYPRGANVLRKSPLS